MAEKEADGREAPDLEAADATAHSHNEDDFEGDFTEVAELLRRCAELEEELDVCVEKLETTIAAHQESERRYQILTDALPDMIARFDAELRYLHVNTPAADAAGLPPEAILGKTHQELGLTSRLHKHLDACVREVFETEESVRSPFEYQSHGGLRAYMLLLMPEFDAGGKVTGVLSTVRDITDVAQARGDLQKSEDRYRRIVETANEGIWMVDAANRTTLVNRRMAEMLGYTPAEMIGRPVQRFAYTTRFPSPCPDRKRQPPLSVKGTYEFCFRRKDGEPLWALVSTTPVFDKSSGFEGAFAMVTDITQWKKAQDRVLHQKQLLNAAVAEKETLLRELYHRTKNNMQVIVAMLDLQAARLGDSRLTEALDDMQYRIQSMALVHQKLYQSQDLSRINLSEYIADLAELLSGSYPAAAEHVDIVLDTDDVDVLIDTAVPCGLILSELVTNALKHAFPEDATSGRGEIRIELRRPQDHEILLRVSDNGVGVPDDFDFRATDTLGMMTVYAIGESQLQGEIACEANHGVTCTLRFRDDLYRPRV